MSDKASAASFVDCRIALATSLIDSDVGRKWTIKQLALRCEISPFHFCRLFRRYYKSSVADYIRTKRIERAKAILAATNLPIKGIAAECGFCNASHFARVFRSVEKESPSTFIRALRSKSFEDAARSYAKKHEENTESR